MRRRILTFHGIGEPQRVLDAGEDDYWISFERFRNILDLVCRHPDRQILSITFDDGNLSDLELAAPELLRRGLGAEFFVLTGRLGEAGSLGSHDVRHLVQMGMRIGSHGVAHCDWSRLSTHELNLELSESKAILEEICGNRLKSASVPFGRYRAAVLAKLRSCGYETVYSSDGGDTTTSRYLRARTSIRRSMTDDMIAGVLSGQMPPLRRIRRAARMAINAWS